MARQGLAPDSSVVIPSLQTWHESYEAAAAALERVRRLPAHTFAECLSVLTRMPEGRALAPRRAFELLMDAFPEPPLTLSAAGYVSTLRRLTEAGIARGKVYDAIVAATVAEAGLRLLTADRRAIPTYALVGVEFELLQTTS